MDCLLFLRYLCHTHILFSRLINIVVSCRVILAAFQHALKPTLLIYHFSTKKHFNEGSVKYDEKSELERQMQRYTGMAGKLAAVDKNTTLSDLLVNPLIERVAVSGLYRYRERLYSPKRRSGAASSTRSAILPGMCPVRI